MTYQNSNVYEIEVEDTGDRSVEVYIYGAHNICINQEPFFYADKRDRKLARKHALMRAQQLAKDHGCKVRWNF